MRTKKTRFLGQKLLLPDRNKLREWDRKQFEAKEIEPKEILRWEDDGGQIPRLLGSTFQLH